MFRISCINPKSPTLRTMTCLGSWRDFIGSNFYGFIGVGEVWDTLRPRFREYLSNMIQSPSVTRLEISYVRNLLITTFIPCIHLLHLTLLQLEGDVVECYEQENPTSEAIPQPQSFSFGVGAGGYANTLLKARQSNDLPMLDYSNLRTLRVNVELATRLMSILIVSSKLAMNGDG